MSRSIRSSTLRMSFSGAVSCLRSVLGQPARRRRNSRFQQGQLPGTYYLIAVADWRAAIAESAESNNTRFVLISCRTRFDREHSHCADVSSRRNDDQRDRHDLESGRRYGASVGHRVLPLFERNPRPWRRTARRTHGSIVGAGDQPVRICLSRDSCSDRRGHIHHLCER